MPNPWRRRWPRSVGPAAPRRRSAGRQSISTSLSRWRRALCGWSGVTEPGEVKRAPVAFCLGEAGAALYAGPDAGSVQLAQLPSGAFITVLETAGDFLRVITSDDSFGYIPSTTAMSEVDLKGGHGRR